MAEIAIFGGTFDPPTRAHEAIMAACLEQKDIDEVWLMPSGTRIDKPGMQPDEVRMSLLQTVRQEVFTNNERLHISNFELELPRPTRTLSTVNALKRAFPEHRWWFVFGVDSYHTMPEWEQGEKLRRTLGMLVVPRAGYELPPQGQNVRHLLLPPGFDMTISSSRIREAVGAGQPFAHLAAGGVAEVIKQHKLYNAVQ